MCRGTRASRSTRSGNRSFRQTNSMLSPAKRARSYKAGWTVHCAKCRRVNKLARYMYASSAGISKRFRADAGESQARRDVSRDYLKCFPPSLASGRKVCTQPREACSLAVFFFARPSVRAHDLHGRFTFVCASDAPLVQVACKWETRRGLYSPGQSATDIACAITNRRAMSQHESEGILPPHARSFVCRRMTTPKRKKFQGCRAACRTPPAPT